jgi:hypothetical protein
METATFVGISLTYVLPPLGKPSNPARVKQTPGPQISLRFFAHGSLKRRGLLVLNE